MVCNSLLCRILKGVMPLVGALALTLPSYALHYSEGDILTDASALRHFVHIVKGTPYRLNHDELIIAEKKFWAGQLSHVLRLSQLMDELLRSPEAEAQFPREILTLRLYWTEAIQQIEQHDMGKFLAETQFANRGLTYAQGMNYRALQEGRDPYLSPSEAKQAAELIKTFINDMNVGEAHVVNDSFKRLSPNAEFTRVHSLVTEILDFYDTAVSRSDIGSNIPASQWIEKLAAEGVYNNASAEDMAFRRAFSRFMEKWHPLKNSAHYSKPVDFLKIPTTQHFKKEYKAVFTLKAETLIRMPKNPNMQRSCRDLLP